MNKMAKSFDDIRSFINSSKEHKDLERYNDPRFTNDKSIGRDVFFKLLSEQGEPISESDMLEILRVIKGDSNIKSLPDNFSFQYLFEDLLKFEVSDNKEEAQEKDN